MAAWGMIQGQIAMDCAQLWAMTAAEVFCCTDIYRKCSRRPFRSCRGHSIRAELLASLQLYVTQIML